jgi:hypothetical protein
MSDTVKFTKKHLDTMFRLSDEEILSVFVLLFSTEVGCEIKTKYCTFKRVDANTFTVTDTNLDAALTFLDALE